MSEPIATHQQFEYSKNQPYHVYHVMADFTSEILPHWHSELEMAYLYSNDIHYIDGERIDATAGDLVVVNSNAVHRIDSDRNSLAPENGILATVIVIQYDFVKMVLPDYENFFFTNTQRKASKVLQDLIERINAYAEHVNKDGSPVYDTSVKKYGYLDESSIILEILYCLCKERTVPRKDVMNINHDKNIERLRGVIQYIERHYDECISSEVVAEKFYFTPTYFSRFFKKNAGMTFVNYVSSFRAGKARELLRDTDRSITDIALSVGFTDSRRLSIAFKEKYGVTPSDFRRSMISAKNGN